MGSEVIKTWSGSEVTNRDAVIRADVVIFAIPLDALQDEVKQLAPLARRGQLWISVGARQGAMSETFLALPCESAMFHPLFAPDGDAVAYPDETIVFSQMGAAKWLEWVNSFLSTIGSRITSSEPETHDRMMLLEQNLLHAALLALGLVWARSGISLVGLDNYATHASRRIQAQLRRMAGNSPATYADIQLTTEQSGINAVNQIIAALFEVRTALLEGDRVRLERLFAELEFFA
jgi:prephenate dehydrogenase